MDESESFASTAAPGFPAPGGDIERRTQTAVAAYLHTGTVSMNWAAAQLSVSVSTLRRRLNAVGAKYADVVDDVRRRHADRYLGDLTLSIGEIAALLGFGNVTAFYRAFKRWHGVPPAAYRATRWKEELEGFPNAANHNDCTEAGSR